MLSKERRGSVYAPGAFAHAEGRARYAVLPHGGVLQAHEVVARLQVLVLQQVFDGHQRRCGNVAALRLPVEVHLGKALGELRDQSGQHVAVLTPEVPVLPDVVLEGVVVHPLKEGLHVARVARLHVHKAIAARVGVGGSEIGGCSDSTVDLDAVGVPPKIGQYIGENFLNRHLYALAPARLVPIPKRRQAGHGRVLGRKLVALGQGRQDRPHVRVSEAVHQPAQRLGDELSALVVPVWPPKPKGGDGGVYEAGVGILQGVVAKAQGVQIPGRAVLQQDVGRGRQRPEADLVGGVLQVKRDAPLVQVVGEEGDAALRVGGSACVGRQPAAFVAVRWLNANHVRAQVSHQPSGVLGPGPGEVKDPQVGQRPADVRGAYGALVRFHRDFLFANAALLVHVVRPSSLRL